MKRVHFFTIIGQTLIIILLAGVVLWPRVSSFLLANQNETATTVIASHFYEIESEEFISDLKTPWAHATTSGEVLALSADSGFDPDSDSLLGAEDPIHVIYELKLGSKLFKPIAKLNFYEAAFGPSGFPKDMLHRTLDFVVNPTTNDPQIHDVYISFTSSSAMNNCRQLNVVRAIIPKETQSLKSAAAELFFQSECFPKSTTGEFRLHQSGGRIVFPSSSSKGSSSNPTIYLSVGDFSKLKQLSNTLTKDSKSQLTSVLEVSEGSWKVIADGFRNPQGLALVDLDGLGQVILETEHGPRGGDEVNIVRSGRNYGWPTFSYGTAYGPNDLNSVPQSEGKLGNSEKPLFSWVPSVAPSQLLQVSGEEFQAWWSTESQGRKYGDILVSTLGDQSLHRLRIEGGVISYSEKIFIGERIRSFSQLPSGKLVLGTDSGKILLLSLKKSWSSKYGMFKEPK